MSRLLIEAQKILQINSDAHSGNEELTNYLVSLFQEAGIEYKIQNVTHSIDEASKRQFNIIGIIGDPLVDRKTRKGLLLLSHLDTSGAGHKEYWTETQGDPMRGENKNGILYGLGASTKIDFLCKLFAAKKMKEHKQKMPIYLAGVCGNNLGMLGSRYLLQSNALNPRYVSVGHPTGGRVGVSHPSSGVLKVQVHFHSVEKDARGFSRGLKIIFNGKQSTYQKTEKIHALDNMLNLISESIERGFDIRFKEISGGNHPHVIPDEASCTLFLTSHQFEDYKRFLREKEKQETTTLGLPQFKIEFGALGDSGVSFLPDTLFSGIQKIKNDIYEYANQQESPEKRYVNFGKIKQKDNKLELFFEVTQSESWLETEKIIKEAVASAATQYPKLNISFYRDKVIPAFNCHKESALLNISNEMLSSMQKEGAFFESTTPNSTGLFCEKEYDSVFFGASDQSDSLFEPNENVSADNIEFAYEYYVKLIERICL